MRVSNVKILGLTILIVAVLFSSAIGFAQGDRLADPILRSGITVQLETVASGFTAPNWGTFAPGDEARLFVSDQDGILWVVDLESGSKSVFADLSALLVPLGAFGPGSFDERGFLGLAFHPDYAVNGLLYTLTSGPVSGTADFSTMPPGTTPNHQAVVREWQVPNPGDPSSVVDPASVREIMRIDEPQFNHNAGALAFGPDDMLYIALGDGGGRDDQGTGHGAAGNAQDPSNVLGSILRIDPLGNDSANGQYGIPADNPFVGQPGYAPEIYAYGFRNPFRLSFDMATGDLYVGDVGQDDIEEVDVVVAGGNYGWNVKEGSFCFNPNGADPGFAYVAEMCPNEPLGLIDPVAEYNTADSLEQNDDGRSVIGGFVYRGSEIPQLAGRYVFGDYSVFTEPGANRNGRLFFLNKKDIVKEGFIKQSRIFEFTILGMEKLDMAVLGFGQDANGELYVMVNAPGVPFGNTGAILKIVRAP